ncbi:MAG: hypothetical protein J5888_06790, partial [Bacteroidaceae bacterium]|nr:hypothetical protein [Bacteroidaceae bacterium]
YDEEEYEEVSKTYYFPQRTSGVHAACVKDYNNYLNSVIIYLPEAGSIELGITRTTPSGGESLTMDDFELWYCGKEAPTAIEEVADAVVEGEGAVEYYSINGVQLSAPQPGINIVKYANGQVKKVFIK